MASIEERVEELVKPKVEELGYELYDVQYSKEGKDYFLRIFIDKTEGIDLNDCEKVSSGINELLDEADYIKEQYFLEVSSPGIERMIRKDKHLENSIGKEIEVKLFKPFKESKEWSGTLEKFDNEKIIIKSIENNEQIELDRKNISLMKEKYNW